MIKYTYFVSYVAVRNDGGRVYGRLQVDSNSKISSFADIEELECAMEDLDDEIRPKTVVLTDFKVIKRRINWWWSK